MQIPDKIFSILRYKGKNDIANLLKKSKYELNVSDTYGSRLYSQLTTLIILSPMNKFEELSKLPESDTDEIIKAFHVIYPVQARDIEIRYIEFRIDPEATIPGVDNEKYMPDDYDTSFWDQGYFKLFLSHPSSIKETAKKLSDQLKQYGISAFVAHEDIEPSKEWIKVIESALVSCDALLALLNNDFKTSNWCDQEAGIAFGLDKLIIPVKLGIDPYGFFGKYQGIQGIEIEMSSLSHEIAEILSVNDKTKKPFAESVIEIFIRSESYSEARSNVKKLDMVKYMNEILKSKLQNSLKENTQIEKAYGVPERVKELLDNYG